MSRLWIFGLTDLSRLISGSPVSYDLHITKADRWLESQEHPIAQSDWLDLVAADPSLQTREEDYLVHDSEGGIVWCIDPVVWIGGPDDSNAPRLWYRDGEIMVPDPDEEAIPKLKEIAAKLGARVLGDDGEEY